MRQLNQFEVKGTRLRQMFCPIVWDDLRSVGFCPVFYRTKPFYHSLKDYISIDVRLCSLRVQNTAKQYVFITYQSIFYLFLCHIKVKYALIYAVIFFLPDVCYKIVPMDGSTWWYFRQNNGKISSDQDNNAYLLPLKIKRNLHHDKTRSMRCIIYSSLCKRRWLVLI